MEGKLQSLADYLGTSGPEPETSGPKFEDLLDLTNSKAFADALINSREFRRYIVNGLTMGDLPGGVLCRVLDHGWGKPPERVEHTGKDGGPLLIREVRSIVVDPKSDA